MAGSTPSCTWSQSEEEVTVVIALPGWAEKGVLRVEVERKEGAGVTFLTELTPPGVESASAACRLELPLHADVCDEPSWSYTGPSKLRVKLAKVESGRWPRLSSMKRDPGHVKVDWSKYDGDGSGEEEEDYGSYLKNRYGVDEDWKPGDGVALVPDDSSAEIIWPDPEPDEEEQEPEDDTKSKTEKMGGGIFGRNWTKMIIGFFVFEIVCWLFPHLAVVLWYLDHTDEIPFEQNVYPLLGTMAFTMGLVDVLCSATGAAIADSTAIAVICWMKRSFIVLSFFFYDALYAPYSARKDTTRYWLAVMLLVAWSLRKFAMYTHDISFHRAQLRGDSKSAKSKRVQRLMPVLMTVESLAELVFVTIRTWTLPAGVTMLGFEERGALWTVVAFLFVGGNAVLCWRVRGRKQKAA